MALLDQAASQHIVVTKMLLTTNVRNMVVVASQLCGALVLWCQAAHCFHRRHVCCCWPLAILPLSSSSHHSTKLLLCFLADLVHEKGILARLYLLPLPIALAGYLLAADNEQL